MEIWLPINGALVAEKMAGMYSSQQFDVSFHCDFSFVLFFTELYICILFSVPFSFGVVRDVHVWVCLFQS